MSRWVLKPNECFLKILAISSKARSKFFDLSLSSMIFLKDKHIPVRQLGQFCKYNTLKPMTDLCALRKLSSFQFQYAWICWLAIWSICFIAIVRWIYSIINLLKFILFREHEWRQTIQSGVIPLQTNTNLCKTIEWIEQIKQITNIPRIWNSLKISDVFSQLNPFPSELRDFKLYFHKFVRPDYNLHTKIVVQFPIEFWKRDWNYLGSQTESLSTCREQEDCADDWNMKRRWKPVKYPLYFNRNIKVSENYSRNVSGGNLSSDNVINFLKTKKAILFRFRLSKFSFETWKSFILNILLSLVIIKFI